MRQRPLSSEFETLFIDLPGHGGDGRWNEPTFKPAIEALKGYLTHGKPAICIGWSMGGDILFSLPEGYRKVLKGIVTIGASPSFVKREGFPAGQSRAIVMKMKRKLEKDFYAALRGFYTLNFSEEEKTNPDYDYYLQILGGSLGTIIKEDVLLSLDALLNEDNREGIDGLDIPALIIHGSEDEVCPIDVADYLSNRLRHGEVRIFRGAGHMPFLTHHIEFNQMIRDFVKGLDG